jgi:hypothetical protein
MIALTPTQLGQDVVLVAAVLVALGTIYRYVIKPPIKFARRLEATMTTVKNQLEPNGGKTLRDAVDRIEGRVANLEQWREDDVARLEQLERIAAAQAAVDALVNKPRPHLPPVNKEQAS